MFANVRLIQSTNWKNEQSGGKKKRYVKNDKSPFLSGQDERVTVKMGRKREALHPENKGK